MHRASNILWIKCDQIHFDARMGVINAPGT